MFGNPSGAHHEQIVACQMMSSTALSTLPDPGIWPSGLGHAIICTPHRRADKGRGSRETSKAETLTKSHDALRTSLGPPVRSFEGVIFIKSNITRNVLLRNRPAKRASQRDRLVLAPGPRTRRPILGGKLSRRRNIVKEMKAFSAMTR